MNREEFQKKLAELGRRAREKDNRLGMEEIREFFQDMELSEEQFDLVFAYLVSCRITVEGYISKQEKAEKKEVPLTQEEQSFLDNYQKELKRLELLTEEAVLELCLEVENTGDALAKARLTEQFLPEVLKLAHEFRGQGLLLGDLVQEGNIGLMLALETLGMRPETFTALEYLQQEIRSAIAQAVEEHKSEKQAGNLLAERLNDLKDQIKKLSDDLERQISIEELAVYMDLPVEEIEDLLKLAGEGTEDAASSEQ